MKQAILMVFILMVLLGICALWIGYGPGISVTVKRELVGPEDEAAILLFQGAPLAEIQSAVQMSGKQVDHISYLGCTLLFHAAAEGRMDVARWLLKQGADPNGTSAYKGMVPLMAAINRANLPMAKLLAESGADPDIDTGSNFTPRSVARDDGLMEILSILPPRVKRTATSSPESPSSPVGYQNDLQR